MQWVSSANFPLAITVNKVEPDIGDTFFISNMLESYRYSDTFPGKPGNTIIGSQVKFQGILWEIIQPKNIRAIKEHSEAGSMSYVRFRLARGLSQLTDHRR